MWATVFNIWPTDTESINHCPYPPIPGLCIAFILTWISQRREQVGPMKTKNKTCKM